MAVPYREALCLRTLLDEVNAAYPGRSIRSDGWIGDAAHAARDSDHNPWVRDARGVGVVRARDITHDPKHGLDSRDLAEHFRALGKGGDRRMSYVISWARIASDIGDWRWRPYRGSNAHKLHVHVSVSTNARYYDSVKPWGIAAIDGGRGAQVYQTEGIEMWFGSEDQPRGDGTCAAAQDACNEWLEALNALNRVLGRPASSWSPLKVDDWSGPKTTGRVFYICRKVAPATVPKKLRQSGRFHLSHVGVVERAVSQLWRQAHSYKAGTSFGHMAPEQVDALGVVPDLADDLEGVQRAMAELDSEMQALREHGAPEALDPEPDEASAMVAG